MSENSLRDLLSNFLDDFGQSDSINATNVRQSLQSLPSNMDDDQLFEWWKSQDITFIASLESYLFWMWTTKKIEYGIFESIYKALTPTISRSWSVPVEITTGLDSPLFDGGFLSREFSIFQYKFTPSNHGFLVSCDVFPSPIRGTDNFDLVLDCLSFLLDQYHFGYLGFRPLQARKWHHSRNAIAVGGFGPQVRQDMLDFDFSQLEVIIERTTSSQNGINGLSLMELLRVRHRAVLDSSLESKLNTLWSAIEAQWGEEKSEDGLFSKEEKEKIEDGLSFLAKEKLNKLLDQVARLKLKTRNDKIIEKVEKLECAKGRDTSKTVRSIHALRSKFAHGGVLNENETEEVWHYISFMMQIFDELIADKFSELNVEFSLPDSE